MTWAGALRVWAGLIVLGLAVPATAQIDGDGWISLFDGKSLDGWRKAQGEGQSTFTVRDGALVAHGSRNHLFYVGPVENARFRDFELKVDVKTKPGSNGGIYFHTQYQDKSWPGEGFEVQVNNSYRRDHRKTGSLYGLQDITEPPAKDNEWFTMHITVWGNHVTVNVDGREVVNWMAPTASGSSRPRSGRALESGTFGLQGHDPGSTVHYRNIRVKPLPVLADYHIHLKGGLTLDEAIEIAAQRRAKFGIAQNCGVGFPTTDDEGLRRFLREMEGKPAYKAMQAEGREWVKMFSPEMIAKFDYVFTDSMTFTDHRGKRTRLWIPAEVEVDDKQAFMDMLVEKTVGILNDEPIDIYVNPTFLPAEIAADYDTLWTDARMDRVIDAAVKNGVAIEINSRYRLPSEKFIHRAKAAGAKFAFGTNNGGKDDLGDLAYSRLMARQCDLTKDDLFSPKPDGQKAIQRKGLPR